MGERAGRPLRDHYKIIRKLAWKKAQEEKKPYEPKGRAKKKKEMKKKLMQDHTRDPVHPLKLKHSNHVDVLKAPEFTEDNEDVPSLEDSKNLFNNM